MEIKTDLTQPLPCIACGKQPEAVWEDDPTTPYAATSFSTTGHYGSTVFDSMSGIRLNINVCDKCLLEHKDRCVTSSTIDRPYTVLKAWNPNED